jgi:hypothetical protein
MQVQKHATESNKRPEPQEDSLLDTYRRPVILLVDHAFLQEDEDMPSDSEEVTRSVNAKLDGMVQDAEELCAFMKKKHDSQTRAEVVSAGALHSLLLVSLFPQPNAVTEIVPVATFDASQFASVT